MVMRVSPHPVARITISRLGASGAGRASPGKPNADALCFGFVAVFVLFEIEGLGQEEIAHALDVPKGTVASRLRRARSRLATMLVSRRLVDRATGGAR